MLSAVVEPAIEPDSSRMQENVSQTPVKAEQLLRLGNYVNELMPKYVQDVLITSTNELEVLIHPEGIVPVLTMLKEHSMTQMNQLVHMTAVDIPKKEKRFEVK